MIIKIRIVKQTSVPGEKFGNLCENHNKNFFLKATKFFRQSLGVDWMKIFIFLISPVLSVEITINVLETPLELPLFRFQDCFVFVRLRVTSKQPGLNGFSTERVEKPR